LRARICSGGKADMEVSKSDANWKHGDYCVTYRAFGKSSRHRKNAVIVRDKKETRHVRVQTDIRWAPAPEQD
jgi:hypothetical protein